MSSNSTFLKRVFRRMLSLHSLKSAGENLDLLSLAIDDDLIFDLAFSNLVDRAASAIRFDADPEDGMCNSTDICCSQWLRWLSNNRAEILIEIHAIVEHLGGIEIVDYLLQESPSNGCAVH